MDWWNRGNGDGWLVTGKPVAGKEGYEIKIFHSEEDKLNERKTWILPDFWEESELSLLVTHDEKLAIFFPISSFFIIH